VRVGVVTSPTGAVIKDIVNVLRRRYPLAHVIVSPAAVQGAEAPGQVVDALRALNDLGNLDVIIVARGGGSLEDLWAFNDERVARAIAASAVPVISAIGHETDFTIADFVADLRAPTPSAAAELVAPDTGDLQRQIKADASRLTDGINRIVTRMRTALTDRARLLRRYSPEQVVAHDRQRVDDLTRSAAFTMEHRLNLERTRLSGLEGWLAALNPTAILVRGYAIVRKASDGSVVRRIQQAGDGEALEIQVSDGRFGARVERT
jgi:exodeoxyribonuclease VII large subunit